VHLGHLLVAQAARRNWKLTRLFFIRPHNRTSSPAKNRAPPVNASAFCASRWLAKTGAKLMTQEIRRGGVSYTIDTARDYSRRFPRAQLFYLIGAIMCLRFPSGATPASWRALWNLRPFAPGTGSGAISPPLSRGNSAGFPLALSSSQIRRARQRGPQHRSI